jgi:hypothetical protein
MSNIVTEESGEPLANRAYVNERSMLSDIFGQQQQQAAAILLFSRGIHDPTTPQTLDALRNVATVFQQESERFLKETA